MNKFRSILIKTFSVAFAVCAAFAIATMPKAVTVSAADEASFKVNGTSICTYDVQGESKVGLRFEAEFNTAWLSENPAEKYTFGMIIAPTAISFTNMNRTNHTLASPLDIPTMIASTKRVSVSVITVPPTTKFTQRRRERP